jgi:hypothetical protein
MPLSSHTQKMRSNSLGKGRDLGPAGYKGRPEKGQHSLGVDAPCHSTKATCIACQQLGDTSGNHPPGSPGLH